MKWMLAYLILTLSSSLSLWAQSTLPSSYRTFNESHPAITNPSAWLAEQYQQTIGLDRFQADSSAAGFHQSFWITVDDQRLHQGIVRIHQYDNGSASLSAPARIGFYKGELVRNWNGIAQQWLKANPQRELLSTEPRWVLINDSLIARLMLRYREEGIQKEVLLDTRGQVESERVRSVFDKPDSTVFINTYQPDPITQLETTYGPIADNDDQDDEALTNALIRDSIQLRWSVEDGQWQLISDFALAEDFHSVFESSNPRVDPPAFLAPTPAELELTRSNLSFEYYHVFYHLGKAKRWLERMGFRNLVNYPLAFDAHAFTFDQSSFDPNGVNSRLRFGQGGVDDAEDADVIVHEYGHAISHSAAPETNLGGERGALDEGFCDYLAISYSRRISDYQPDLVFNWDGHNEYWDGRELTDTRTYPTDKERDIYGDGILWTSALAEISEFIGLEATDRIAIQSVFEWYPNMLLSDAARLFIRADSLLYDAAYGEIASIIFCDRGLLPGCEDTLISTLPFSDPYIGNTEDFAFNNEPLYIFPNGNVITSVEVIDLHGRSLYEESWSNSNALFYPFEGDFFRQGTYILRIHTEEGPYSFKVIRTWL